MQEKFETWDVTNIKEKYLATFDTEIEAINMISDVYENGIYTIRKVYVKE